MHICRLSLPQFSVKLPYDSIDSRLLMIGGGRAPALAYLTALISAIWEKDSQSTSVWAIDRGINLCRDAGIPPARLIGDGDSADAAAWAWALEHGVKQHRYPVEKDDTDTALALQMAAQDMPHALVVLTAAFGGRLDHLFSTAAVCGHVPIPCVLTDERETLFFLRSGESLSIQCMDAPRAISLLAFTEACTGVSTQGLYWELSDARVSSRSSTSISNVLAPENTARRFSVTLGHGVLGVYLCHKE